MNQSSIPNLAEILMRYFVVLVLLMVSGVSGCSSHHTGMSWWHDPIVFSDGISELDPMAMDRSAEEIHGPESLPPIKDELSAPTLLPSSAAIPTELLADAAYSPALDRAQNSVFQSALTTATDDGSEMLEFARPQIYEQPSVLQIIKSDQVHFYCRQNIRPALLTLGGSAILANTTMDQEYADWYQDDVRSHSLNQVADFAKSFGEHWPMVGAYCTASVGGRLLGDETRLAHWGDRSFRSMLVGVPPLLFLQKALGASRPRDVPPSSNWHFWADDNGASGHAFVGAVPFLVAAQLAEKPRRKAALMALSTMTGWSRINDNDHYLSQVIVGWWLAYASTQAVENSDASLNYQIVPAMFGESMGLEMIWRR